MTEVTPEERRRMLLEAYGEYQETIELQDDDLTVSRAMRDMGWSEERARTKLNQMARDGVVKRYDRKGVAETIYRPVKQSK